MTTTMHRRPTPRGPLGWSGAALAAYVALAAGGAAAQSTAAEPQTISLRGPFHTASDWHVTVEQPNPDYEGMPARVCFWTDSARRTDACRDSTATLANGHTYPLQILKELSVVPLATAKGRAEPGLLIATARRGTQDGLVKLEIWVYRRDVDQFVEATPPALPVVTMQSEYRVLANPAEGTPALFVVANRIWNFEAGEALFDPHRFTVRIYRFDPTHRRYRYVEEYVTRRKYPSLDHADEGAGHRPGSRGDPPARGSAERAALAAGSKPKQARARGGQAGRGGAASRAARSAVRRTLPASSRNGSALRS